MNWYERELIAQSRHRELEKEAELWRIIGERRPLHFWLVALLRAWLIGVAR